MHHNNITYLIHTRRYITIIYEADIYVHPIYRGCSWIHHIINEKKNRMTHWDVGTQRTRDRVKLSY